jgi:hypothetical protein
MPTSNTVDTMIPELPPFVSGPHVPRRDHVAVSERIITWDERASSYSCEWWEYVAAWIDVRKLDALLPLASNMWHVRFAGENGIAGKYTGVDKFVRSHKSTKLFLMPEAKIERACKEHPDRDIIYIFNGRHRFAWMRDHGAEALPVAVLKSEASEIAQLVGTDARVCRVTMLKIPEWKLPEMERFAAEQRTAARCQDEPCPADSMYVAPPGIIPSLEP